MRRDAQEAVAFSELAVLVAATSHEHVLEAGAKAEWHDIELMVGVEQQDLTADRLRVINRHQVDLLKTEFERLDCAPSVACVEPMPDERRGGFLAIRATAAIAVARRLRERGVHSDARGDVLRLGPAPYLCDEQLRQAVALLADSLRAL